MSDQPTEKEKQIFKDTLTGKIIARDVFGTPMIEGEILLHAAGGQTPEMRVLKILEVRNKEKTGYHFGKTGQSWIEVSLKVRRAERRGSGWNRRGKWTLQDRHSFITTLQNCIVLTDPKPEILDLFKDVK